jgi:hypothetical protein
MEERKPVGMLASREIKAAFIIVTIIFFITLFGFGWIIHDLRHVTQENTRLLKRADTLQIENQKRIGEIQENRLLFCVKNYDSIYDVFKPFFPPKPRTVEQQKALDKFQNTVERLKHQCPHVLNVKPS